MGLVDARRSSADQAELMEPHSPGIDARRRSVNPRKMPNCLANPRQRSNACGHSADSKKVMSRSEFFIMRTRLAPICTRADMLQQAP